MFTVEVAFSRKALPGIVAHGFNIAHKADRRMSMQRVSPSSLLYLILSVKHILLSDHRHQHNRPTVHHFLPSQHPRASESKNVGLQLPQRYLVVIHPFRR